MNCVSPEEQGLSRSAEIEKSSEVLAQLAEGLHAMAQPLTILRGALGALQLEQGGEAENRRYVEMSNVQTGRLCRLLTNLRSLIEFAQFPAVCESVDLFELAEQIVADNTGLFRDAGVQVTLNKRSGNTAVALGDSARTEQAMRSGLDTAIELAAVGDEIRWQILPDGFVLENEHAHGKRLSSPAHVALSVVETAILSQRGTCTAIEDPFCLSIRLPGVESNVTSEYLKPAV